MYRMFEEAIKQYRSVEHNGRVFFDRGIIEIFAYAQVIGAPVTKEMELLAETLSFNRNVFVTPPWQAIYCTDTERKQDFSEATEIYGRIVSVYQEYGYKTIILPKISVEERANFILESLEL